MKSKDLVRLGKISVKARKKSSRNTVGGMSFGLILLVPMIFFSLAFFVDVTKQVNKSIQASTLTYEIKSPIDPSDDDRPTEEYSYGLTPAFKHYNELAKMKDIKNKYMYTNQKFSLSQFGYQRVEGVTPVYPTIKIGNNTYDWIEYMNNSDHYVSENIRIVHADLTNNDAVFSDYEVDVWKNNEENKTDKPILLDGYDKGFTKSTSGKGEIVVSEVWLDQLNISAQSAYGKKLTIQYPEISIGQKIASWGEIRYYRYQNVTFEYHDVQPYLFYEYEIVGIIDKDYYKNDWSVSQEKPLFIITDASMYLKDGNAYEPLGYDIEMDLESIDGQEVNVAKLTPYLSYAELLSINKDDKIAFLMPPFTNMYDLNYTYENGELKISLQHFKSNLILQMKDYTATSAAIRQSKNILSVTYGDLEDMAYRSMIASNAHFSYYMTYTIGMVLVLTFGIVGGTIFVINMLNLLNTIRYSVQSRKNYIGMMRAIGARNGLIPKMYMFELLILFGKVFLWVAIFASLFSVGIKYLLDWVLKIISIDFAIKIIYYPIALGATFLSIMIIGYMFALFSSWSVSRKPILEVLRSEEM